MVLPYFVVALHAGHAVPSQRRTPVAVSPHRSVPNPHAAAHVHAAAFRCVAKRPQRNVPKLLFHQVIIARGRIVIHVAGVRVILVDHAIAIGIHVHFNARHFVFLGH